MADFYLWARALTALLGTATVLLLYQAGMRWGTRYAALAAGLLAVRPMHVTLRRLIQNLHVGAPAQRDEPVSNQGVGPLGNQMVADVVAHLGEGAERAVAGEGGLVETVVAQEIVVGRLHRGSETLRPVACNPQVVADA